VKVATVERKNFSDLMKKQGAKACDDQEKESSEMECRGLKCAMLKGATATSMGVRERIESVMSMEVAVAPFNIAHFSPSGKKTLQSVMSRWR
jgi:hypothetical protein